MKVIKFSFVFLALISLPTFTKNIKVAIASETHQKVAAVCDAFKKKFINDDLEFIAYKSDSMVPAQPVGKEIAQKGAQNRINNLPQEIIANADYVVSIENFIEKYLDTNSWCDRGLVLIIDNEKKSEKISLTQPTFIPNKFVQLAQQMSSEITEEGYSVTVGQAIQNNSENKNIDAQDWHKEIEFGGVPRQQLLQDAIFKILCSDEIDFLKKHLMFYPDFPKKGILFVDFLPILNDSKALQVCINLLAEQYKNKSIDVIVGLESRGFIIGTALAYKLGIRFVPVRKPGKLPGATHSVTYEKEYGSDTLTIAQNALKQNERILIVDDLIATGGSARAAIKLVELTGAKPIEFVSLLKVHELAELAQLGIPAFNLID